MKRQSVSSQSFPSSSIAAERKPSLSTPLRKSVLVAGFAVVATGYLAACSSPDPQAIDYQSSSRSAKKSTAPSLAAPPDLMTDARTRADAAGGGDASLADYHTSTGTLASTTTVLPSTPGLALQGDGSQRWLVVSGSRFSRDQLWARLRVFWQEQGFFLTEDTESRGIMQTDWQQSRAKLDQGIIRNTLSMAVDNAYVSAERNRYRTRLQAGPDGAIYVFISQQGLHEVLSGSTNDSTQWTSRPNDPGLEADYLGRLQRALAEAPSAPVVGPEAVAQAKANAAKKNAPPPMPVLDEPAPTSNAQTTLPAGVTPAEQGALDLSEDYDHTWARVGQALDRGNFTVDTRDKARGVYEIRYADPNDLGTAAQGFWNQVFHGKKEKVATPYHINVKALTENQTRVAIVDNNGQVLATPLTQRIMRLLVGNM
ncbi:outer membrane protein assembly factor BamC [Robbsia sp. KACC 23696]|uniref:outer membrane protein assembly factor BamC n=1 Tax=Robbsia sp. KACC 23696 TaxID=3149231 RepID=UPI00325B6BD6